MNGGLRLEGPRNNGVPVRDLKCQAGAIGSATVL